MCEFGVYQVMNGLLNAGASDEYYYSTSRNKCPMDHVHSNIHSSLSGLSSIHHTNPLLSAMTKSREIRKITARLLRSHSYRAKPIGPITYDQCAIYKKTH